MPTIERDGSSVIMFTAFVAVGFGNGVANHVVSCELCLPVHIMEWEVPTIFVVTACVTACVTASVVG